MKKQLGHIACNPSHWSDHFFLIPTPFINWEPWYFSFGIIVFMWQFEVEFYLLPKGKKSGNLGV